VALSVSTDPILIDAVSHIALESDRKAKSESVAALVQVPVQNIYYNRRNVNIIHKEL